MHALSETVTAAILLVLCGLGIGLAFRAGLFNIGAEGQMVVALATAVASFAITGLPIWIHLPLALVIGLSVGALYAAIAGILKAAIGAHEVISTIMLNLISFRLLDYVLRQPFIQKEGRSDPISKAVLERRSCHAAGHRRQSAASCRPIHHAGGGGAGLLAAVPLETWLRLPHFRRESRRRPRRHPCRASGTMAIAGALAGLAGATQISGVLARHRDSPPASGSTLSRWRFSAARIRSAFFLPACCSARWMSAGVRCRSMPACRSI